MVSWRITLLSCGLVLAGCVILGLIPSMASAAPGDTLARDWCRTLGAGQSGPAIQIGPYAGPVIVSHGGNLPLSSVLIFDSAGNILADFPGQGASDFFVPANAYMEVYDGDATQSGSACGVVIQAGTANSVTVTNWPTDQGVIVDNATTHVTVDNASAIGGGSSGGVSCDSTTPCDVNATLSSDQEANLLSRIDLAWIGVWFVGGVSFGVVFGQKVWGEVRKWHGRWS